jgi:hypothetical protein
MKIALVGMMSTMAVAMAAQQGFWRRRVTDPLLRLFHRGEAVEILQAAKAYDSLVAKATPVKKAHTRSPKERAARRFAHRMRIRNARARDRW